MDFRSKHRLKVKVGGQNHLNDDVMFEVENEYGVPVMGAIQKANDKKQKPKPKKP